ncbi:distal tail protein Dit [Cytobacillus oceanisediminis]|uniref:distal tail protein Dit n=1 Tax=Cytobacillus oceanisediminis TaxID=665099 RepID=UPI0020794376|nr:distal tail protein Dit [Cytobacillus oceanisediminis]USK43530.1 phage tail family protein [Cytobacillus oceanisediminis]
MDWGLTYRGVHSSEKGLRFTNISGRDTLPDIESRTSQTASKHGVHYFGYRFQERRIRAEIALYGSSLSNFRSKIRDIAAWLNPYDGPGELIFDDEPDKKYFAVITDNTDFEGMFIKRVAEIEFLCPDPFAYAISETVATISGNSLNINNDGTAETFPVIEITADGTAGPDNYAGKVSGETLDNPHVYGRRTNSALGDPTVSGNWYEPPTVNYNNINLLNNSSDVTGFTGSNVISQHKFSFNLIALIKRKFGFTVPGVNLAEQVQWLKTNISSITANWWGKGTNKQADPIGIANFVGKVSGSTVENPHKAYRTSSTPAAGLMTPTTGEVEFASDNISYLDGTTVSAGTLTSTRQSQHLFSFNLIEYVQRKYSVTVPGATTADKVQWLKDNISRVTGKWYGFGSGPSGNLATFASWYGTAWEAGSTNTSGTVAEIIRSFTDPTVISNRIDSSGFIHFLAYAEASDGTTASTINTDYVELEVELKAGQDKGTIARWHNNTNSWIAFSGHSNLKNTISKVEHAATESVPNMVDSNGFCHFLAYAEPSNGISPSTIETDYIELQVTLSGIGGIKVSNGEEFIAITRTFTSGDEITIDHQAGTVTLNGVTDIITGLDIESDFFPLQPGQNDLTVGGGTGTVTYTKRWL